MIDTYNLYDIGSGHLKHNQQGFLLTNNEGLHFTVPNTYSINADFYWYQLGDIICVADYNRQFYIFPKGVKDVVAKTKIACELLYQLSKSK